MSLLREIEAHAAKVPDRGDLDALVARLERKLEGVRRTAQRARTTTDSVHDLRAALARIESELWELVS